VALVHVARRRLGLEDTDYRAILLRVAGVDSATRLDDAGFRMVMDAFAAMGFQSDSAARHFGRRPGMASAGHVAAMRRLWADYTQGEGTDATLGKWLERTWGVSALRFVTAEQAPKVLAVLKGMTARRSAGAAPHAAA
jgi:hypothetical protein